MLSNKGVVNSSLNNVIENYFNSLITNFQSYNLLPIGSVIYSIFPLTSNNGKFIYGPY